MVKSCAAKNCKQRYEKGISFHFFPTEKTMLKQWLDAMKRKDWTPSKTSVLCCKHFTADSYQQSGWSSKKALKPTAVPSIFCFPEDLQKRKLVRPPSCKRNVENKNDALMEVIETNENIGNLEKSQEPKIKKRREHYVDLGDFQLPVEYIPDAAVKYYNTLQQVLTRKNNKIRLLQQSQRRLKKKLSTLEDLIKNLRREKILHRAMLQKPSWHQFLNQ